MSLSRLRDALCAVSMTAIIYKLLAPSGALRSYRVIFRLERFVWLCWWWLFLSTFWFTVKALPKLRKDAKGLGIRNSSLNNLAHSVIRCIWSNWTRSTEEILSFNDTIITFEGNKFCTFLFRYWLKTIQQTGACFRKTTLWERAKATNQRIVVPLFISFPPFNDKIS